MFSLNPAETTHSMRAKGHVPRRIMDFKKALDCLPGEHAAVLRAETASATAVSTQLVEAREQLIEQLALKATLETTVAEARAALQAKDVTINRFADDLRLAREQARARDVAHNRATMALRAEIQDQENIARLDTQHYTEVFQEVEWLRRDAALPHQQAAASSAAASATSTPPTAQDQNMVYRRLLCETFKGEQMQSILRRAGLPGGNSKFDQARRMVEHVRLRAGQERPSDRQLRYIAGVMTRSKRAGGGALGDDNLTTPVLRAVMYKDGASAWLNQYGDWTPPANEG